MGLSGNREQIQSRNYIHASERIDFSEVSPLERGALPAVSMNSESLTKGKELMALVASKSAFDGLYGSLCSVCYREFVEDVTHMGLYCVFGQV